MSDHVTTTTVVGALVAALAFVTVGLRFYTRHYTKNGYGWDDWLILIALLATLLTDALVLWANSVNPHGAQMASATNPDHSDHNPTDVEYIKLSFTATVLYFTITSATKLSILLMYRRLFSIDVSFRRQILIASLVVVGFWIGCTVADMLNCIPLEWTWRNNLVDPRYCFNYNIFWLATGIVEACIDLVIIVMPIRMVMRLQMNNSKKIAVAGVFLVGVFVILSGLIKVGMSYQHGYRGPSFDKAEVWTTVHSCIGIVCACLPVCYSLFVRLGKKIRPRSWSTVGSMKKHWYRRSGLPSTERLTGQRSDTPELEQPVQTGVVNYELPLYKAQDAIRL